MITVALSLKVCPSDSVCVCCGCDYVCGRVCPLARSLAPHPLRIGAALLPCGLCRAKVAIIRGPSPRTSTPYEYSVQCKAPKCASPNLLQPTAPWKLCRTSRVGRNPVATLSRPRLPGCLSRTLATRRTLVHGVRTYGRSWAPAELRQRAHVPHRTLPQGTTLGSPPDKS